MTACQMSHADLQWVSLYKAGDGSPPQTSLKGPVGGGLTTTPPTCPDAHTAPNVIDLDAG